MDIEGAGHDQAVGMLTGLDRFVRLVVEREVEMGSPPFGGRISDKSPKTTYVPRDYNTVYGAGRFGPDSKPRNGITKTDLDNSEQGIRPSAWNGPVESVEPPRPAPRRFTKTDSESNEKTEPIQVGPGLFPKNFDLIPCFCFVLFFIYCRVGIGSEADNKRRVPGHDPCPVPGILHQITRS